jgi:DNA-binding beta-propeller fold protein YncE
MRRPVATVLASLAMSAGEAAAQGAGAREIAFVANAEDGSVSLVDVARRIAVGRIDVNPEKVRVDRPGTPNYAQDTDVSPDGRTLYVSRGYLGDVAAFDVATGRQLWRTPLKTVRADHMTITPDGKSLLVSALTDNTAYRLDTRSGAITGRMITGVYPHDNQVSRDGRRLFNSSIGDMSTPLARRDAVEPSSRSGWAYQLTVADTATLQVTDRIRFEKGVRPWRFTPDEKGLYAQLSNEHAVIAYDLQSRRITRRLELPVAGGVSPADWDFEAPHHGLALTPDGRTLCIAGRASDYAALVRAPELSLIATIPVGDAPGWSEVAEGGRTCLVANTRSDDLSFISVAEREEVARLKLGDGPKHITVARVPARVLASVPGRPASASR